MLGTQVAVTLQEYNVIAVLDVANQAAPLVQLLGWHRQRPSGRSGGIAIDTSIRAPVQGLAFWTASEGNASNNATTNIKTCWSRSTNAVR